MLVAALSRPVRVRGCWWPAWVLVVGAVISARPVGVLAASLAEAQGFVASGAYAEAAAAAAVGRELEPREEAWWRVEAEALLALGRYTDAAEVLNRGLRSTVRESLRLRLLAFEASRLSGEIAEVERYRQELRFMVVSRTRSIRDVERAVALGEAALLLGAEPRVVLENFLKRGRESRPPVRDAFLAIGRLALEKHDYALASRTFQEGLGTFRDDPDLWTGLAASFRDGDRTKLVEYAGMALTKNEHHAGARLLLAENKLDSEAFAEADADVDLVLAVNPRHPEALALRSVLAHLRGDRLAAATARTAALATWRENPHVDHLIGRKLAQRGFHHEAAPALRRSLGFDPNFTPARIELAQALLRSGREAEGWALADQVHSADGYDVAAFNLVNLRDRLETFTSLVTPNFTLRMGADEAPFYGDRALALLERAHARLTTKYGVELTEPTAVEIFPNPKDFSVRTFGMPGGPPAFLGVCFGPLVTVNSPSSKRANWEAVLWHEYAHTITLALSQHRIPKWLTEGISVYEEVQENPAWGQLMSVDYHQRIVEGRTQPISRMSAAFLEAESLTDVTFAYYQSYLVVQFLVDTYGFEQLRATLASLGTGTEINAALAQHFAPLADLDTAFAAYARTVADQVAGPFDLRASNERLGDALAQVDRRSYFGQLARARALMQDQRWLEARLVLKPLAVDGFYLPGRENVHQMIARVARELGDASGEREALTIVAERESDALEAGSRLLELAQAAEDPSSAARWADYWIAINPLAPTPWRALFTAHEALGDVRASVAAGEKLLKLDPPDRAAVHYRIARLVEQTNQDQARHHVLLALEEAPRFRGAHALLAALPLAPDVAAAQGNVPTP